MLRFIYYFIGRIFESLLALLALELYKYIKSTIDLRKILEESPMIYGINIWAVLVSAVVSIVIGSIWYGPLFGKQFMAFMGVNKPPKMDKTVQRQMMRTYTLQVIASLLMFMFIALLVSNIGPQTVSGGIMLALLTWIGVIVPVQLGREIWGGKMGIFWLSAGNMLVTCIAAGAIIGAWA